MAAIVSGCTQPLFRSVLSREESPPSPPSVQHTPAADDSRIATQSGTSGKSEISALSKVAGKSGIDTESTIQTLPPSGENTSFPGETLGSPNIDPSAYAGSSFEEKPVPAKNMQTVIDEGLDYIQVSQEFWQKGELENALEALDQAYALLLRVDIQDSQGLIQQKEDLRFLISKRILEIYASRNIVVNGNHEAIPIVLNKYVLAEIKRFTGNEKAFFTRSYQRSGKYRTHMAAALREAGLPTELSWLPLIESGYKSKALSSARALGLWQFIPSTGYKFGLKRDKYIDERMDPIKSTRAATEYLKALHQIFGDWSTALAAYNCGEGRVLRLIRGQNINYLDNFWDLYEQLPSETSRYFPRYLATLHMINNPDEYGLDSLTLDKPLLFETIMITRQVHLKDIARTIGVSETTLRELNPELRYGILPNEEYPLRVPPEKTDVLMAKLNAIPLSHPPQPAYIRHKVRSGESLSTIAERYHTRVSRIVRANNIRKKHYIVAGTVLKIPTKGSVILQGTSLSAAGDGKPTTYKVKSGDSLWILAKRYRTTTKKIVALNNLPNTNLHIGQVLKIPGRTYTPATKNGFKPYRVKSGESPFRIAKRHNMSLERFLSINNLSPRSKIYPGQTLYIE